MKLLVTTQILDTHDPVLGFFHHWIEKLAPEFETITVVALSVGTYSLPHNVTVHSLGKEHKGDRGQGTVDRKRESSRGTMIYLSHSRLTVAYRYLMLVWKLRKDYDAVFVHMNPEYLCIAGWLFALFRKPCALWYNHTNGSPWLALGQLFAKRVYHTSPFAYTARYKVAKLMPAGIDTELFVSPKGSRNRRAVYFQGRISKAKKVDVLLSAIRTLRGRGEEVTLTLVGPEDSEYGALLRSAYATEIADHTVVFLGPKRNEETPALYGVHGLAVNLTAAGNFDKTALEAMSTETPVIVASHAFTGLVPEAWVAEDETTLVNCIQLLIALPDGAHRELGARERSAVIQHHSLDALVVAIGADMHTL